MKRFILGLILVGAAIALVGCGGGKSETAAQTKESSKTSTPDGVLVVKGFYIGQDFEEAVANADKTLGERLAEEDLSQDKDEPPTSEYGAANQYHRYWDVEKTDTAYVVKKVSKTLTRRPVKVEGVFKWGEWKEEVKPRNIQDWGEDIWFAMYPDKNGKLSKVYIGPSFVVYLFGSGINNLDIDGFGKQLADGYDLDPFEMQWNNNYMFLTQVTDKNVRVSIYGTTDHQNGIFSLIMQKEKETSFD